MGTRINGVGVLKVGVSTQHDSLPGLKGGDTAGRFHVTSGFNTIFTSGAHGDIIYHDGNGFVRLGADTSGYLLETRSSGYAPVWAERNQATSGILSYMGL